MNWKTILTIAKKDIKEASQNKAVWLPILIVPAIFVLIIPAALIVGFSSAGTALESPLRDPDFAMFLPHAAVYDRTHPRVKRGTVGHCAGFGLPVRALLSHYAVDVLNGHRRRVFRR